MKPLTSQLLDKAGNWVSRHLGLSFANRRLGDLQRGVTSAAADFGFAEATDFVQWLPAAPTREEIQRLAGYLTVGETYFFREWPSYRALEQHILPDLIGQRRGRDQRLRIWSAGCCTGEEAYSLAILLHRLLPDIKDWDITILGTDINRRFLNVAAQGEYCDWSFRDVAPEIKARYFTGPEAGRFRVLSHFRKLVTFEYLNLADEAFAEIVTNAQPWDVIFCRNVIMYLEAEKARQLINRFSRCLDAQGWLFVSVTEASHSLFSNFKTVNWPGVIAYQKTPTQVISPVLPDKQEFDFQPPSSWTCNSHVNQTMPVFTKNECEKSSFRAATVRERLEVVEDRSLTVAARMISSASPTPSEETAPANRDHAPHRETIPVDAQARQHADRGEWPDALDWCGKAIDANKLDARLHYLRGTVLQETGQWADAIAAFKKALFINPGFVMAHLMLGCLARREGQTGLAEKHFDRALWLLNDLPDDDPVPESEGTSAGQLARLIGTMTEQEILA